MEINIESINNEDHSLEDELEDLEGLSSENYLNSIKQARKEYKDNKTYSIDDI